jgi:thiol-disulfide isomerase/thioredoxin
MRFVTLIFMILVLACTTESDPDLSCTGDNPVAALDWLQSEIESMKENPWFYQFQYITRARYGYKIVFLFKNCCPNCLSVVPVYDCSGKELGILGNEIKVSTIHNEVVVWKAEDSSCSFN